MNTMILNQKIKIEKNEIKAVEKALALLSVIALKVNSVCRELFAHHDINLETWERLESKRSPQSFRQRMY
jgi:hypothetical protein